MDTQKDVVRSFRGLKIWQKAHELTLCVYQYTKSFPAEEKFGLVMQLRRSASSVPANIVEGHSRLSRKEFVRFLSIAKGSLEETKYFLILAKDLNYLSATDFEFLDLKCAEIGKMSYSFQKRLL